MVKFKEEHECSMKVGANPVVDKIAQLARGIHAMNKNKKSGGWPHLMDMQKMPGKDDAWLLAFEGLTDEVYAGISWKQWVDRPREERQRGSFEEADAASFNRRVNTIGKRIFGSENFKCDAGLAPGGRGTGMIVMNWQGITTCKIKFPGEPDMETEGGFLYQGNRLPKIKMLDNADHIDVKWKNAVSNIAEPIGITIRNTYEVGYHDSDIHEINEAYYWQWCSGK